jgi:peptidyl-prolyl cis-trans isomerase D
MFDFVRTHSKLFFFVLMLLIIPSFVLLSQQGYSTMKDGANAAVAKVDGRNITQAEWDAAHRQQAEQLKRQVPDVDPRLLDSPEIKREALDRLVRERVLMTAATKQNIVVTDERLQTELMQIPQLAQLRAADGSIDIGQYKALLQAQGLTPEGFEAGLRQDAMLRQALEGAAGQVPTTVAPARAALDAFLQRREVHVQLLDAAALASKVNPSTDDLQAYYKASEAQFRTTEQAVIEYVVLDAEALMNNVSVSADDVRKYYDENAARSFTSAEERQASHILIKADKSASASDRAAAKAQAEKVLVDVRKAPGEFAALAKKLSQDEGSAAQGGDLGFFGKQAMTPPFEAAVFAMKPGEISNVIETDFGYHIIRLQATRGGERQPFESVRAKIEADLKKEQGRKRFTEVSESFGNTVYEQSESLQGVVDKFKLTKQAATVARTPATGASGPLASRKLIDAVFSNDTLKNKRNTEAVETGSSQLTAARVTEHQPARVRPFDEVKDAVRAAVVAQQAAALAKKDGEARLAKSKTDNSVAGMPAAVSLSRAQTQGQPPEVVNAVLNAPTKTLPHWLGVDLGSNGYAVVRINSVTAPAADSPEVSQLAPRYAQAWAAAQAAGYYESLKARYGAEVLAKPGATAADVAVPMPKGTVLPSQAAGKNVGPDAATAAGAGAGNEKVVLPPTTPATPASK